MPRSDARPDDSGWLTVLADLEQRRELLYDTKTGRYLVFEEQHASPVSAAEARRLFPDAFDTDAPPEWEGRALP